MTHKEKATLARKISGKQTSHFESDEWQARKDEIARKIKKKKESI